MSSRPLLASFALTLVALASPADAYADGFDTYTSCGTHFGTCASVRIATRQVPGGAWRVDIGVLNQSYGHAKGANQAAGFWLIQVTRIDPSTISAWTFRGPNGVLLPHWLGEGGFERLGIRGYDEVSKPNGDVAYSWWGGGMDPRCAADARCNSRKPQNYEWGSYQWVPGVLTMSFTIPEWTGKEAVQLEMLTPTGHGELINFHQTTVTPEPVTLTLLATGLAGVGGAARRRRPRSG